MTQTAKQSQGIVEVTVKPGEPVTVRRLPSWRAITGYITTQSGRGGKSC